MSGPATTRTTSQSSAKAPRRGPKPTPSGKSDKLLAEVLALEQADERPRRILQSLGDGLAVLDLAGDHPARQIGKRLRPELQAVGDDEALDLDAVGQDRLKGLHAVGFGGVVLRDQSADRNARKGVHATQRRVENLAADVLEIAVDAVRRSGLELIVQRAGLVVDASVEAELLHHVIAFLSAAGDAHRAAALDLRDLADHAADRTRGR